MTNETKHTPTPWEVCPTKRMDAYHIVSEARHWSVDCSLETVGCSNPEKDISDQEAKANAAHIVKCVNMHDELVEALDRIIDNNNDENWHNALNVLKKAGAL